MKNKFGAWASYWPEVVILLLCAMVLTVGISEKKGYHMDELLSFELANAEYNPWIVPTQPQGRLAKFVEREIRGENAGETFRNVINTLKDVLERRGDSRLLTYQADVYSEPVWIEREQFVEYVTVNRQDAFHYFSVYFNVKDDNHPPLHFMLLHTVSSFFRERLNPWMGCSINLVFVLGSMLLLMRLGRICMTVTGFGQQGRYVGDGAALVYGLSAGAMSTTLLIRMYAMLTFFCLLLLLLHLQKFFFGICGGDGFEKKNGWLILATLLGFWTQYFFLFYCFTLAAVTVLSLWKKGRRSELLRYCLSMLAAAGIGLVFFPFAIADVFSSGRGVEALQNLSAGFLGYGERLITFAGILGAACGVVCILALLLIWLSRGVLRLKNRDEDRQLWIFLTIPTAVYFLLAARMSPYLVDRYIMPVFPLAILALSFGACRCLAAWFAKYGKQSEKWMTAMFCILALCEITAGGHWDNGYLYSGYAGQESIARQYRDLPCICVYEGVRYYENLPEFMQYEKTLLLTAQELSQREDKDSVSECAEAVVLIKNQAQVPAVLSLLREYGLQPEKTIFSSGQEVGDTILLVRRAGDSW